MKKYLPFLVIVSLSSISLWGCSSRFVGGAAVGAVGAGAAYEIQAKRQMDQLDEEHKSGKITSDEYEARKKQIEKSSLIY